MSEQMPARIVDHFVVAVTEDEQQSIAERLWQAGFPQGDLVYERGMGAVSRLLPIAGGGFVELTAIPTPPKWLAGYHDRTPRVASVSYTTTDAAADLERWRASGAPGAFAAAGGWTRKSNGTPGFYIGACPVPLDGRTFFTVQERRLFPLPYPEHAETAPRLLRLKIAGAAASWWRKRHQEWFGLDGQAGDTELVFRPTAAEDVTVTATFAVPRGKGTVPLAGGAIELVPATPDSLEVSR